MLKLGLVALGGLLFAASGARADCNQPTPEPVTQIEVFGHPFSAIPTADGCAIFVSLPAEKQSRLSVFKRDNGTLNKLHDLAAPGQLTGMALSPDGRFLAGANGAGVLVFDTGKLLAGAEDPLIASSDDGPHSGSIYAAFSPDGRLLFIANERSASLSVYDVAALPGGLKLIGQVPVAGSPVGLTFSPDGKYLYSTSQAGPRSWEAKCTSEGPPHPEGVLLIIDASKAAADPAKSMVGGVAAGCNAVRVALSPDAATAYVTARGANAVLAFDTGKLVSDPTHALRTTVPVGTSPVGVTAAQDKVFVTNSSRFAGGANQSLSVLDAGNLSGPQTSIAAGGFPRELKVTADGRTLLVTNFSSGSLELVDLARLPAAN
jgi:DNA-binding beta-propeller fold protein YncE